jgi:hypothetical protein
MTVGALCLLGAERVYSLCRKGVTPPLEIECPHSMSFSQSV